MAIITGNKNLTFATGMVNPKTTALFFDKLWVYPTLVSSGEIPQEVCMDELLEADVYMRASMRNDLGYAFMLVVEKKHVTEYRNLLAMLEALNKSDFSQLDFFSPDQRKSVTNRNQAISTIVKSYEKRKISVTPVYFHNSDYDEISRKEVKGLVTCFDVVPTILETKLEWKQVIEFRQDKKAREKLNRLRRWFSTDLLGKSEEEIKAIIEKKLDDYQWALKKHGIETIVGGMTTVIPALVSPSIIQLLNASHLEIALGGLALTSGAIAWVTSKMIERTGIKRSEVAYIYDVQKIPE